MLSCGEVGLSFARSGGLSVLLQQKNTKRNDLKSKDEFWQVIWVRLPSRCGDRGPYDQNQCSRLRDVVIGIIKMTWFACWSVQDETYGTKQASKAVKGLLLEGICM